MSANLSPRGTDTLHAYLAGQLPREAAGRAHRAVHRYLKRLPPEEHTRARAFREAYRHVAEQAGRGRPVPRLLDLPDGDRALLALRHAGQLSIDELAEVLERPRDEVELALDVAEARARRTLGEDAPAPGVARATILQDLFTAPIAASSMPPAAEAAPDLEVGALVGGRYRLVEQVGRGAFGSVFRAEDEEVEGHVVALKILGERSSSPVARRAALRELRLNAAVFHPSLVQFKDHGWLEDRLWFVMPWYEGETLEARLERGPLPRDEAQAIFRQLAEALAALHGAGIRHQDVKPENVMLTRLPEREVPLPVLLDFGVATDDGPGNHLGGTPLYFAPEVAARFLDRDGETRVGPEADVFALALSLRNALEPETQPEVGKSQVLPFIASRVDTPPPMPERRDLRFLRPHLKRWMSLDPLDRPTAAELVEELDVLTRPERRRAVALDRLRAVAPVAALLLLGATMLAQQLDARARRQEAEAQRAWARTSAVEADLEAVDEARRGLALQVREVSSDRQALAASLADREGELVDTHLRLEEVQEREARRLAEARQAALALRQQLTSTEAARRGVVEELEVSRGEAASLARRLAAAEAETRRQAEAYRVALAEVTAARDDLSARWRRAEESATAARLEATTMRAAHRAARDRVEELEHRVDQAERARGEVETELSRVRARIAQLAEAVATPAPEATSPTTL